MSATMRRAMVQAAKERLAELSRQMGEQDRARQMFPSTSPLDRGAVSPLGGVAKPAPKEPPKTQGQRKKFVW
jgi:hypothetical protein